MLGFGGGGMFLWRGRIGWFPGICPKNFESSARNLGPRSAGRFGFSRLGSFCRWERLLVEGGRIFPRCFVRFGFFYYSKNNFHIFGCQSLDPSGFGWAWPIARLIYWGNMFQGIKVGNFEGLRLIDFGKVRNKT